MALCPFATHLLIPPGSSDPRISPRVAVLHVDAGNSDSLYTYFRDRSGGIESHFHIKKSGAIEQYRDTNYQADANNLANDFAVSIETQGYGEGEWTPEQIASIKRLLVWLNQAHPAIRLAKVDRWDGSGIGYHVQFGAPGPWTPVSKSCPGPDRVQQYHNVIVPWLASGADQEEDPMADPKVQEQLDRIEQGVKALGVSVKRVQKRDLEQTKRLKANVLKSAGLTDDDKAFLVSLVEASE